MRVAVPRQLAFGLADLPVPVCRWQALPEETRTQVLGLLARLIARGVLAEDLRAEAGER